ncbi:sugar phosphate isomerase/epimerase [Paenibacillus alginolyticus]|uniref:sugar phosphate isomerase/epimerase family protein n=1 Tax=Paenibacillus alginolyticus TaxID=59839 RepID=UPI00041E011C|nr:sugar phosphate isomerase/epimerase family protein [Paenibacillus alginolyticus]MCY9665785.1 sugar phosphate isomerase/epimerase [Paenibacillus alginolyticus]
MNKLYKLGICQWSLPVEGPYACKIASELGFEGIQLEIGSYERGFPLSRRAVQQAYLELAELYGISFTSIAVRVTDEYSMTQPYESADSGIVREAIIRSIDAADAMNISSVMIPSFQVSDIVSGQDFSRSAEVLISACDYASDRGITIATENLLSVEQMFRLADCINRPNLKLYFDTQNYALFRGYDAPEMLEKLAPLLCNEIHVKDGKQGEISASLLGEGDSEFFRSMRVLRKIGYHGWIVLENYYDRLPLRMQHEEPESLIKEDMRILLKALS